MFRVGVSSAWRFVSRVAFGFLQFQRFVSRAAFGASAFTVLLFSCGFLASAFSALCFARRLGFGSLSIPSLLQVLAGAIMAAQTN